MEDCLYILYHYFSYTDDSFNVYHTLAENYEHSMDKGICNNLNNEVKDVQDYIQNEYNIPVVSNAYANL